VSALAKVSGKVIDQTIHGLTTGALTPGLPPEANTDDLDGTEGETREL
jgi:hypothetical protein